MALPARDALAILDEVSARLCEPALPGLPLRAGPGEMPSLPVLGEIMTRLRAAIFPGFFGKNRPDSASLRYHLAANLDTIHRLLAGQIVAGLCFACQASPEPCAGCDQQGREAALAFMAALPEIRRKLTLDAEAAYEGDPAAFSPGETIFCYPSLTAMFHHRISHELFRLKIPIVPRIIAEMAHSTTGIDIHPGARIGESFFIDHGTGVVIGETAIIGAGCRLYQGVTLGALSFPKDLDGSLTRGIARHPILEDDVTVYANATILGRITIGKGSVIGGNTWVTRDVPPNSKITLGKDW
ncbi:MAG: serine acetyltransferase [Desulfovibrio sp.]|nr:serine acetyltransferase [Desulfovibrio sp.]